jgi:PAS domain S-box-containing protein
MDQRDEVSEADGTAPEAAPETASPTTEDGELSRAERAERRLGQLPGGWGATDVWSALFESAPMAYAIVELDGSRSLPNRRCFELFGAADEGGWVDSSSFGHPDDVAVAAGLPQRLLSGELDHFEVEQRYLRADGSVFWGHMVASLLTDEHHEPWALLIAIDDVSDRVEARAALSASEARWRALVQHAADVVVVIDDHARLQYASPSAAALIGEPTDPLLGTDVLQWVHPDDQLVAAQTFLSVLEVPGVAEPPLRMRLRRRAGDVRYVEMISDNLLDEPAVGGIVINIRDLTDAEQVSSALEMTENRHRRMLENISDTVTLLDEHGTSIMTTGNLRTVMGYPTAFWDHRNVFDLVHPEDEAKLRDTLSRLLSHPGEELGGEVRMRRADGHYIDAELSAVNLLDDPDVQAIVLTSRNISERKRVERELAEARDEAVRSLQMRTGFIASVSHELRTPIHGILGLSELLAAADLDEEARALARSIAKATDSLRMVLDDILDFTKIEVGRLEIVDGIIDVQEMAEDVSALFEPQARAKGITLDSEFAPGFPTHVVADALRLRQVLNNLIGNAIKFTAEGGVTVLVAVEPVPAPSGDGRRVPRPGAMAGPTERGLASGQRIRVTVRDSGIGVPPDSIDDLFLPFSQLHHGRTAELGGTGLGLSIARRLVELMGGELGYTNRPDGGSDFWFTLPLVVPEDVPELLEAPAPTALATRRAASGAGRVLVVEDNTINQLLVTRQLERLGYHPQVVDSGPAALEAFPLAGADAVLMDWQLPGIDGLETTRRLRRWEADHARSPTPVIAMTASALPGDRARCLDAGMDDFLAKPVSVAALGEVLARWVSGGRYEGSERRRSFDRERGGPTGAPATAACVDPAVVDVLVEELDDAGLVISVIRTYLRELEGRLTAITEAREADDAAGLDAAAHVLRSTSAAVGALGLSEQCAQLEHRDAQPAAVGAAGGSNGGSAERLPTDAELRGIAEGVREELGLQIDRLGARH